MNERCPDDVMDASFRSFNPTEPAGGVGRRVLDRFKPNGSRIPRRYKRIERMNRSKVFTSRDDISDMPHGLVVALSQLDEELAKVALGNWQTTGEEGRSHYCAYLSVARTRRAGRKRGELAARQLTDPFAARTTAAASARR